MQIKNLDKVYLKKTCYKITEQKVVQIEQSVDEPQKILNQMSDFESG